VKDRKLVVRCSEDTLVRFKRFAAEFEDYEAALRYLLEEAERLGLALRKPYL